MLLDFEIDISGIKDSPISLLKSAKVTNFALNVLLTMKISAEDRKKYSQEKIDVEQKIKELELEIQELANPSQLLLF